MGCHPNPIDKLTWFQTWLLLSISYMGCHPNPIDELHHFSRWLFQHQPDMDVGQNGRPRGPQMLV